MLCPEKVLRAPQVLKKSLSGGGGGGGETLHNFKLHNRVGVSPRSMTDL